MADKKRELPSGTLEHDFVVSDESVNRYGWRLLVAGIDTEGFLKNPVCCVQHNTWLIPVGKWKNLRVDGQKLLGTVEFDRNDDDAVKLYWKYKDGYMNAVSLNVVPVEESDDASMLIKGQKYPTLVRSELLEISLVTLPGQKNAVKLSHLDGSEYKLHLITKKEMAKEEKTVEQLQKDLDAANKLNAENLIAIHKARGVVQDGETASLQTLALSNYDAVKQMLEARTVAAPPAETRIDAADEAKALALVKLHLDRGAIGADQQKIYEAAAKADYEGARKELEAKPGRDGLNTFVAGLGAGGDKGAGDERSKWGYLDWYKKDPEGLRLMEEKEPEKHRQLAADFATESKKMGISI